MERTGIIKSMANGVVTYIQRDEQIGRLQWNDHPKCKGVSLKHLVTGGDTDGKLSCHLVKLEPDSVIDEHVHELQLELHEVIEGEGGFIMGARKIEYYPGCVCVIPAGTAHKVIAGGSGLVLFAKFCPALM